MLQRQIGSYLAEAGIGQYDEKGGQGNIFIEHLPAAPDKVVAIFRTGGYQSDGKLPYDDPTIQIVVRGKPEDVVQPSDLAQAIFDELHGFRARRFALGGYYIVNCIGVQSGPVHIGADENRRHEYSLNFQLHIQNDGRRP